MAFSIKDFFFKCDQIRRKLKISLIENFIIFNLTCEANFDDYSQLEVY